MQVLVTKTLHDLLLIVSDRLLVVAVGTCIVWVLPLQYETVSYSEFFGHQRHYIICCGALKS